MLSLKTTARFRKDYKRLKKQGKDMNLLQNVIDDLLAEKVLDKKYKDHALVGDYVGFRECHILPDCRFVLPTAPKNMHTRAASERKPSVFR